MSCFGICFKKKPSRMSNPQSPSRIPGRNNNSESIDVSPASGNNKRRNKMDKDKNRNAVSKISNETKSTKPLYELKDKFRCLFCGGENCKHEDWTRNKKTVIKGLNCDKINEDLFASQRPSTVLIEKYNIVKKFQELNIGLIVNVQRQGEHPYCGPNKGLEEISGFTYHPEAFTTEGIRVRLSGWKDMNVPSSIPFMLDIVKDMLHTTREEKRNVLVHCHAGYGRTGIVLACYLIFTSTKSAEEVVRDIRSVREECVQKKSQMEYCKTFKNYIDRAREIFTSIKKDIDYFIKHQVDLSYSDDLLKFQHVPKLIYISFERFIHIKNKFNLNNLTIYKSINGSSEWEEAHEKEIVQIKINLNKGKWECLQQVDDINIISEICFDWLEDCVTYVISPARIKQLFTDDKLLEAKLKQHIADPKQFNRENRKSITKHIRERLRMIEFETISSISHFASKVFPSNDKLKEEFRLMLEKLAIYMLGYNIDSLYENHNREKSKEGIKNVENLIDIVIFFIIIINHDLLDDTANSFSAMNQNLNSSIIIDNMSQYVARKQMEDNNENSSFSNTLSVYNNNLPSFLTKHLSSSNDKGMVNKKSFKSGNVNNNTNKFTIQSDKGNGQFKQLSSFGNSEGEKDYILYNMYKSLHKHFKVKNLGNIHNNSYNASPESNNFANSDDSCVPNTSLSIKQNEHFLNDFYNSFNQVMLNKHAESSSTPLSDNERYTSKSKKLILKNDTIAEEKYNLGESNFNLPNLRVDVNLALKKEENDKNNSDKKGSQRSRANSKNVNFEFKEVNKDLSQAEMLDPININSNYLIFQDNGSKKEQENKDSNENAKMSVLKGDKKENTYSYIKPKIKRRRSFKIDTVHPGK